MHDPGVEKLQPRSQGPLSTSRSRERTLGTRLDKLLGSHDVTKFQTSELRIDPPEILLS